MTIRLNPRWLLISALLFSLQLCRAQVVPPTISFDLGPSNSPESQLWDVGGAYTVELVVTEKNGVQVPVEISFNLVQDANGKLSSPTNDIQGVVINNNSVFLVTPKITAKGTGSGGAARVHFTVKVHGSGQLGGNNVNSFNASLTVDAEADAANGTLLVGNKSSKFSASFPGQGSLHGTADFSTPLAPGVDGHWNLTLQLVAISKVTGTGIITTQNRAMGLEVNGNVKNGQFKLTAKGTPNVQDTVTGVGSSATILMSSPFDTITLKGKILGQKLLFSFTQPPPERN